MARAENTRCQSRCESNTKRSAPFISKVVDRISFPASLPTGYVAMHPFGGYTHKALQVPNSFKDLDPDDWFKEGTGDEYMAK